MYLGLDVGTSRVKAIIVDETGVVAAESTQELSISRPKALWSEQAPEDWWSAVSAAVKNLPARLRFEVDGIGLSGQMHGAVLLDAQDRPLRPAILWNDGRSASQCAALEQHCPDLRRVTGNVAMPGFTAPKLLWLQEHEPRVFEAAARVLLPKDFVRLRMTGDYATDMSDASGTLWLDVGNRCWSPALLAACGLDERHMPALHEGTRVTGTLRAAVAADWGMRQVPVVAGGGDNAAGAVGCGVVRDGEAFLSLGTSGVIFVANEAFSPAPERGVHAFCHALPGSWHQMAVILSATACVDWISKLIGIRDPAEVFHLAAASGDPFTGRELFLPYLSGERTPHNDPDATGALTGLTLDSDPGTIVRAVLEGIAFALADGLAALESTGTKVKQLVVIGGGARSSFWGRILASALDRPLVYCSNAHIGPAFGAARLARIGLTGEPPQDVATPLTIERIIEPDRTLRSRAKERQQAFSALYPLLRGNSVIGRTTSGSVKSR